jgi:DNA-binding transcriptional regulator LsrR (DeoR family)
MSDQHAAGPAALVLTATVARRYYLDGATKSDIAAELGLSRFKVARLLDEARATGVVRIELDSPGNIDLDLSVRLAAAYELRHCVVMDGPEDDEQLLRTSLGRAAAELVAEIVEPGDVLGLAWARSLMPMRTALRRLARCDVVQLNGVLSLLTDESPVELVRDVARRSAGQAYVYYAPMILPDEMTARALRTQPEVARAAAKFCDVTKAVVGVGAWQKGQSTVADALTEHERNEIYELGVRSELSGIQLDAHGEPLTTALTPRLIGIEAEQLRRVPEVIGVV